ncbi:hypothetical protein ABT294_03960, partial [Nonomuraea sp. NPDC000554]|uniref:hypothetical protein n=1 Tax=Nonomuraea sp. NPDC000554 TaxID=3154259 RepID=UPI003322A628
MTLGPSWGATAAILRAAAASSRAWAGRSDRPPSRSRSSLAWLAARSAEPAASRSRLRTARPTGAQHILNSA